MITLLRVLFGFIIACLVAGVVTVAFVVTPADIAALPAEAQSERLGNASVLSLLAATHSAIFALPFALIAIGIAELWRVRSWIYYVLAGIAIALAGFAAEYLNEVPGQPSIFNNYALGAFVAVGVLSGIAFWLVAGRRAGGKRGDVQAPPAAAPPAQSEPVAQAT
jgi:phosphoglycerol transferase MdoB-like AlkP superfamily enzyme